MRKDMRHPYLKGYTYWAPIINDWINSPMYTDSAKVEFMRSLNEMQNDKAIAKVEKSSNNRLI